MQKKCLNYIYYPKIIYFGISYIYPTQRIEIGVEYLIWGIMSN